MSSSSSTLSLSSSISVFPSHRRYDHSIHPVTIIGDTTFLPLLVARYVRAGQSRCAGEQRGGVRAERPGGLAQVCGRVPLSLPRADGCPHLISRRLPSFSSWSSPSSTPLSSLPLSGRCHHLCRLSSDVRRL